MRHELSLAGHAFGLRPIADSDAAFAAALRADPALNRHIHAGSGDVQEQLRWMQAYYERERDYYFVVESLRSGSREGLISVYDIDAASGVGEWGRWVMRQGSLAAVESAWLIYKLSFEMLQLSAVLCRTVADNLRVVSFHDSCGIGQRRELPGFFTLRGQATDGVEHRVERDAWPALSARLERLALLGARRANRG